MTFWKEYSDSGNGKGNQGANSISYDYVSKIYIGSGVSNRFVEFPAFIRDLKYTVDKETETISDKDKQGTLYIERSSTVSMNLDFDVPANSAKEAKHNLIRVSEIMRMISTSTNTPQKGDVDTHSRVYILFSNLISRGSFNTSDVITSIKQLKKDGLPGYIKDFDYTPDIDAGFFYDKEYRAPKNIKVKITMSIEALPKENIQKVLQPAPDSAENPELTTVLAEADFEMSDENKSRWVIRGLSSSGEFTNGDTGGFPFGVKVRDSRHTKKDFSYEKMNKFESSNYSDKVGSYFMIGNWYSKPTGKKKPKATETVLNKLYGNQFYKSYHTPAYCCFRMFLEDFKFSKKTNLELKKVVGSDVGVFYSNFSDENSEFDIKFSILADTLEQAKKNCGKIQVLFRLLFSENKFKISPTTQGGAKNIEHTIKSDTKRRIYAPNLFESSNSDKQATGNLAKLLLKNGVGCQLLKVDANIINDLGFFIEKEGTTKRYYPKGFTINLNGAVVGIAPKNLAGYPKNYNSDASTLQDSNESIQFPFKFK